MPPASGYAFAFTSDAGTLSVKSSGEYSFVSNADSVKTDTPLSFTFTVQDGDGDKVSNTLNLTVHDVTLSPITVGEGSGGATVYEAQLLGGTDAQASGALSAWTPVSLPEGQSLVPGEYKGAHGTFTVEQRADGGYQYRYALASALSTDGDRLQDADTYTLTVHDTAGNTGVVTLTVDIVDDAPKAGEVTSILTEGSHMALKFPAGLRCLTLRSRTATATSPRPPPPPPP